MGIPLGDSTTAPMVPISQLSATGSPSSATYLRGDGTWGSPAGAGTVTSIAMTGDGVIFNSSITGSPVTASGTFVPSLIAQAANTFLAGPTSAGPTAPTFRAITAADVPTLNQNTTGTSGGLTGTPSITVATATITTLTNPIPNTNLPQGIASFNTAQQSTVTVANTPVYVTSSNLNVPVSPKTGIVVGTTFEWDVVMVKTAAGTGAFNIIIYTGTNGTTADTASVTQSIGTQTAAVDSMRVLVKATFTAVGASGSFFWSICPFNKAVTATGFGVATGATGQFTGTVSSFNTTTANLKFGLGFTSVTGTPTITIPIVMAQAYNLV